MFTKKTLAAFAIILAFSSGHVLAQEAGATAKAAKHMKNKKPAKKKADKKVKEEKIPEPTAPDAGSEASPEPMPEDGQE